MPTRGLARIAGVAASALAAVLAALPAPATAQDDDDGPVTVSRPVIQRIPGRDSMTLNEALTRLGRNPRDVGALIDAGNAALTMGDVDAATGFFRRADQLSPGNPKVKAGLAGAMVRNGNPFEAIPLFQEAERAGAIDPAIAGDRGLAYDLVGDNAAAQRYYRIALAAGSNDEVARRLALSLAIAGDRRGSDAALSGQLRQQDQSAWRTRAFALAILGQTEEAVTIARTILPGDLATAIAPYLRYMPRLTPAQQAAAANFGAFPRASEIGRDDPRIALYAPASRRPAVAAAETTQAPRGRQTARQSRADRERAQQAERTQREALAAREAAARTSRASTARVAPGTVQPAIEAARPDRPAVATAAAPVRVARAELPPVVSRTAPPPAVTPAPVSRPVAPQPAPAFTADPLARAVATPAPSPAVATTTQRSTPLPAAAAPVAERPVVVSTVANPGGTPSGPSMSAPVVGSDRPTVPLPEPGFDLTRLPPAATPAPAAASPVPAAQPAAASVQAPTPALTAMAAPVTPTVAAPTPAPAPAPTPAPTLERPSLASAFADLGRPTMDVVPAAGAVDIRRLQPARPKPAEVKPAKPAPPSHPSRIWVQIATGRDKAALNFDWRRLTRQSAELFKGKGAFVSAWGQTNRLLTGPFGSESAANAFIAQLRRADVSGPFVWTSPAGQVVDALGGR